MNTPAHLIIGTTAFGKAGNRRLTLAAAVGSFVPDFSLYAMVLWSVYVSGIAPGVVFGQYYYSPEWQQVFAVDNSFILWGLVVVFALWSANKTLLAFSAAGFLHLCFDFPLHNHDARKHFWPVTDWVFVSPFSYWDRTYHAALIAPLEMTFALGCCFVLFNRHKATWARGLLFLLLAAEMMASGLFRWLL